jgi:hypothetical protein
MRACTRTHTTAATGWLCVTLAQDERRHAEAVRDARAEGERVLSDQACPPPLHACHSTRHVPERHFDRAPRAASRGGAQELRTSARSFRSQPPAAPRRGSASAWVAIACDGTPPPRVTRRARRRGSVGRRRLALPQSSASTAREAELRAEIEKVKARVAHPRPTVRACVRAGTHSIDRLGCAGRSGQCRARHAAVCAAASAPHRCARVRCASRGSRRARAARHGGAGRACGHPDRTQAARAHPGSIPHRTHTCAHTYAPCRRRRRRRRARITPRPTVAVRALA